MGDAPSAATTRRFPALCQDYGAERLGTRIVAAGGASWAWMRNGARARPPAAPTTESSDNGVLGRATVRW